MYLVSNLNYVNKGKFVDGAKILDLSGFMMGSQNKIFNIDGVEVRKIEIMSKKLANPLVGKKVMRKYNKLIVILTELLVDDDDSGDSLRQALNQIEKFRLEIKNKYRYFLKQKELEKMSKQLTTLQKEAKVRLLEIQSNYLEYSNQNNRSR